MAEEVRPGLGDVVLVGALQKVSSRGLERGVSEEGRDLFVPAEGSMTSYLRLLSDLQWADTLQAKRAVTGSKRRSVCRVVVVRQESANNGRVGIPWKHLVDIRRQLRRSVQRRRGEERSLIEHVATDERDVLGKLSLGEQRCRRPGDEVKVDRRAEGEVAVGVHGVFQDCSSGIEEQFVRQGSKAFEFGLVECGGTVARGVSGRRIVRAPGEERDSIKDGLSGLVGRTDGEGGHGAGLHDSASEGRGGRVHGPGGVDRDSRIHVYHGSRVGRVGVADERRVQHVQGLQGVSLVLHHPR